MDKNIFHRNELLAQKVIKGLESRNMSGYYAEDRESALRQALALIPEGSTINMGGCQSAGKQDGVFQGFFQFQHLGRHPKVIEGQGFGDPGNGRIDNIRRGHHGLGDHFQDGLQIHKADADQHEIDGDLPGRAAQPF